MNLILYPDEGHSHSRSGCYFTIVQLLVVQSKALHTDISQALLKNSLPSVSHKLCGVLQELLFLLTLLKTMITRSNTEEYPSGTT